MLLAQENRVTAHREQVVVCNIKKSTKFLRKKDYIFKTCFKMSEISNTIQSVYNKCLKILKLLGMQLPFPIMWSASEVF